MGCGSLHLKENLLAPKLIHYCNRIDFQNGSNSAVFSPPIQENSSLNVMFTHLFLHNFCLFYVLGGFSLEPWIRVTWGKIIPAKDTIYAQRIKGKEGFTINRVAHCISWTLSASAVPLQRWSANVILIKFYTHSKYGYMYSTYTHISTRSLCPV